MAVTQLERKKKKLRARASVRRNRMKAHTRKPVIKNVDIEELKKSFEKNED